MSKKYIIEYMRKYMKSKKNLPAARRLFLLHQLKPMLATLSASLPTENHWIYEIKFDGFRALAFCENNNVNLISRNNKSFNEKFYPILDSLKKLNLQVILDGEIAVLNDMGIA